MDVCVHVWVYVHVSMCVSMYMCVCVENSKYDASLPPNNSTWVPCGKDAHFHKHRTITKIRKLNTDTMLLSNPKSISKFCYLPWLAYSVVRGILMGLFLFDRYSWSNCSLLPCSRHSDFLMPRWQSCEGGLVITSTLTDEAQTGFRT